MTYQYALAALWPKSKYIYRAFTRIAITVIITSYVFVNSAFAQSRDDSGAEAEVTFSAHLLIGAQLPEAFWSMEHLIYQDGDTIRTNLESYRGKLLILDFWASWCGACLVELGKLESLSKDFAGQANILLVNSADTRDDFQKVASSYQRSKGSYWRGTLNSIIVDSYIKSLFPHIGIPYQVWINPKGTVYAFTRSSFVDPKVITTINQIYR
ncbi:TlpA family protein disulfide reductase [Sphingobacterium chungjuense]|uniref:TlpA family protein disulfide reductase n=1 Tax=Sphingobacterium chungjuense TaxID=2675553 RepID=UPI00140893BD|nr:TlpA disulfide reductase family protein [Sphingobacterium chungjuense]